MAPPRKPFESTLGAPPSVTEMGAGEQAAAPEVPPAPPAPTPEDVAAAAAATLRAENEELRKQLEQLRMTRSPPPQASAVNAEQILAGDPAELEAQLAMKALQHVEFAARYREQLDDIWLNVPPKYQHWYFHRVGLNTDPRKIDEAERLLGKGFVRCPAGVHNARFAADGAAGINVMCPPRVHEILLEDERLAYMKWAVQFGQQFPREMQAQLEDRLQERAGRSEFKPTVHTSRGTAQAFKDDVAAVIRAV